jgi:hypothetical protein
MIQETSSKGLNVNMKTGQASKTRIEIVGDIIRDSIALRSGRALAPAALAEQASAWMRRLDSIPTPSLMPSYDRIAAGLKHALTPQDLIDSYRELKLSETRHQKQTPAQVDESCGACFGVGYQTVRDEYDHTSTRPCACSAAPANQRSREPLSEKNGWKCVGRIWVKAEQQPREYQIKPAPVEQQSKPAPAVKQEPVTPEHQVVNYKESINPVGKDGEKLAF